MYSPVCSWLWLMGWVSDFRCLCVDKASLWNIPHELNLGAISASTVCHLFSGIKEQWVYIFCSLLVIFEEFISNICECLSILMRNECLRNERVACMCAMGVTGGSTGSLLRNVFASESPRSGLMFFSPAVSLRWTKRLACHISPVKHLKRSVERQSEMPVGPQVSWGHSCPSPQPLPQERQRQGPGGVFKGTLFRVRDTDRPLQPPPT